MYIYICIHTITFIAMHTSIHHSFSGNFCVPCVPTKDKPNVPTALWLRFGSWAAPASCFDHLFGYGA